jgi:hypothetical protein
MDNNHLKRTRNATDFVMTHLTGPTVTTDVKVVPPMLLVKWGGLESMTPSKAVRGAVISRIRLSVNCWLEEQIRPGWIAAYRIAVTDNRPVIAELRIFPGALSDGGRRPGEWAGEYLGFHASDVPVGGLPASAVRGVVVGKYLDVFEPVVEKLIKHRVMTRTAPIQITPARGRRGRPARPDAFYAGIARSYIALLERGVTNPLQVLAKEHRLPRASTVRGWIAECRRRRLIERPGRKGPVSREFLTAKGKQANRTAPKRGQS